MKTFPLAIKFPSEYFDARSTLECGQIFRFAKIEENTYEVFSCDKRCVVKTEGKFTYLYTEDAEYFYNFFDLDTDYAKIADRLNKFPELSAAVEKGKGIRILRQNLVETIISFIISANNNIPRIKKIISRLCELAGEYKDGYYAFPTLDRMSELQFHQWQSIGAGFRDKYLHSTVKTLKNSDIITQLPLLAKEQASKTLCSLLGVGPKVADCISLFGLHDLSGFPVDTWILKTCSTESVNTPSAVRKFYTERYGEYAGIAQQYIFFGAKEGEIVEFSSVVQSA